MKVGVIQSPFSSPPGQPEEPASLAARMQVRLLMGSDVLEKLFQCKNRSMVRSPQCGAWQVLSNGDDGGRRQCPRGSRRRKEVECL
jgi:hypothetical protein